MGRINLTEPRRKVERAQQFRTELQDALENFLSDGPFGLEMRRDEDSGLEIWYARITRPVPESLTYIVGDLIHNLRIALDFLSWQLVISNGTMPESDPEQRKIALPIYDLRHLRLSKLAPEKRDEKIRVDRRKHEALFGREAFAIIEQMQMPKAPPAPEPGRPSTTQAMATIMAPDPTLSPLWMLTELDNVGKHRLAIAVGGTAAYQGLFVGPEHSNMDLHIEELGINSSNNGPIVPIVDGTELMRVKLKHATSATLPFKFEFFLAFGVEGPGRGQNVTKTCDRLIQFVVESLDRFTQLT